MGMVDHGHLIVFLPSYLYPRQFLLLDVVDDSVAQAVHDEQNFRFSSDFLVVSRSYLLAAFL